MKKIPFEKIEAFATKHKKLLTLGLFFIVLILIFLDKTVFDGGLIKVSNYINGFFALIFFTLMTFIAGYTVLKSLFLLGAELTLVIFLAQSYCLVPERTAEGDSALQLLIAFGIFYIILEFAKSLYKKCADFTDGLPKKDRFWSGVILLIFLLLVGIFLYSIYQVVSPIFTNLCIYEPAT